jgi:hypothetical protein
MASVIIVADAWLFYLGMTELNWGGTSFSGVAALATGAYVVVLMFVTYVGVTLRENLKKEHRS